MQTFFTASDLKRSAKFYEAALGALGYRQVCASGGFVGYGVEDNCDLFALKRQKAPIRVPRVGFHLAFAAPSRAAVDTFFKVALKHGGKDNGGCGVHKEYGPSYYAGFVLDPDGYWIEPKFRS